MARKEGGGKGCLKWGCIGCVALVVLALVLMALFSGVAWQKAKSQEVRDDVLTHELPAAATEDQADGPEGAPDAAPEESTREVARVGAGRVILTLRDGSFTVNPGREGEPLKVKAKYDAKTYQLVEGFDEGDGDGTWTYRLEFHRTGSLLMAMLAPVFGGTPPEVKVFLPPDVRLDVEMDLKNGGSEVDLGGLWLSSADIRFRQGGLNMEVSEPLREPIDRLSIRGGMGGLLADHLGNASPRHLQVDFRMGGMNLDLRGAWQGDADIDLAWDMGGGAVDLPPDVMIEGVEGHTGAVSDGEVPLPTLRFELTGKKDDMEFRSHNR